MLPESAAEQLFLSPPRSLGVGGRSELVCDSCGYGVVVRLPPPRCPMCGDSSWAHTHELRVLLSA